MRAGRQGAGDRLGVDIALIGERQPDVFQRAADIADPRARADDDALAIEVGADQPLHVVQAEQQTAGRDDRRERMAGAGDADGKIPARGLAHELSQFVFRMRLRNVPGDERLVADPVAPMPTRPEPRRRSLRDIRHVVIPLTAGGVNETSGIKEARL